MTSVSGKMQGTPIEEKTSLPTHTPSSSHVRDLYTGAVRTTPLQRTSENLRCTGGFHRGIGKVGKAYGFKSAHRSYDIKHGAFCRAIDVLAKDRHKTHPAFKPVLAAFDGIASLYDALFTAVAHADRVIMHPVRNGVIHPLLAKTDSRTLDAWKPTVEWLARFGAFSSLYYPLYYARMKKALGRPPTSAEFINGLDPRKVAPQVAQKWTGLKASLAAWAPFFAMGWMMSSEILANPDRLINMVGGASWQGESRMTLRSAVMGAQTLGSLAYINHNYRSMIDGKGKISFAHGAAWMMFWFLYTTYFDLAALQDRGLTAIDGKAKGTGLNPLQWKRDYFSPSFVSSQFGSWAATSPMWGVLGGWSRSAADHTWQLMGRTFKKSPELWGTGFNDVIPLVEAEKAALRQLPWYRRWPHAFGRVAFNGRRMGYSFNMFAWNILIAMEVSRATQVARSFESKAALKGSTVRPIFTSLVSLVGFTPVKAAGFHVSSYAYYAGGMTLLSPYEYCNEQKEAFGILAKENANRFFNTRAPEERIRLWMRVQTFAVAAHGQDKNIVERIAQKMDAALTARDMEVIGNKAKQIERASLIPWAPEGQGPMQR